MPLKLLTAQNGTLAPLIINRLLLYGSGWNSILLRFGENGDHDCKTQAGGMSTDITLTRSGDQQVVQVQDIENDEEEAPFPSQDDDPQPITESQGASRDRLFVVGSLSGLCIRRMARQRDFKADQLR